MPQQGQKKENENIESQANPKMSSIPGGKEATELFRKGQEIAGDVMEKATEYASDASEEVTTVLRRYPVQSLLVGFGLGCFVGALVSRR
jgi:hypothetical protein